MEREARWVRAETGIRAPAGAILAAFTRFDLLRAWWEAEAGLVEARPGGAWALAWGVGPEGFRNVVTGVVESVTEREVRIGTLVHFSPERGVLGPTRITLEVKARSDQTLVKLTEEGFGEGGHWDALYADAQQAWPATLLQLKAFLERA